MMVPVTISLLATFGLALLSCPVKDCMASPNGGLVNGAVEDFSADDGTRQDEEESDGFGRGRAVARRHVAVEEDFDAGSVHEDGRD